MFTNADGRALERFVEAEAEIRSRKTQPMECWADTSLRNDAGDLGLPYAEDDQAGLTQAELGELVPVEWFYENGFFKKPWELSEEPGGLRGILGRVYRSVHIPPQPAGVPDPWLVFVGVAAAHAVALAVGAAVVYFFGN